MLKISQRSDLERVGNRKEGENCDEVQEFRLDSGAANTEDALRNYALGIMRGQPPWLFSLWELSLDIMTSFCYLIYVTLNTASIFSNRRLATKFLKYLALVHCYNFISPFLSIWGSSSLSSVSYRAKRDLDYSMASGSQVIAEVCLGLFDDCSFGLLPMYSFVTTEDKLLRPVELNIGDKLVS